MKETVNVSIGSQAFTLDTDAYRVLRNYLDEIRSRLPEGDAETMDDIEAGIAEIFRESVSSPMRVISIDTVRRTIGRMGTPSEFGRRREERGRSREYTNDATFGTEPDETRAETERDDPPRRKLYRSRIHRSIAGVCGGLADYFGWDVSWVRIVTLCAMVFAGLSIWVYIIFWIVIPEAPESVTYQS